MFKANNKDTRTMSMTSFWYVVIVKLEHNFTPFSSVYC